MNQNPTIRIRMLGSFTLQQDGMPEPQPVSLTGRSGRLWTLAAYLILRRDHGVPAQELIELLWPNGDNSNPASTLQNNASRVRSALAAMGFTDAKSLIRFEDGCYKWAPDRETLLDADEFEALALRAIDENDPAKALETARQALDLYEGNFLAEASTELWCANLTTYYRSLFMRVSRKAAYELMKEQRFPEAITLCSRVVQLDPMAEEFSILLMRSFTANMQPQQALEHFQLVREHYQREFGIEPSSDLETEKRAAMQELYGSKLDESLLQSFLEQDRREKTAFYCDNGTFREIMKLQLRALRRSETPAQLLMLVLEGLETQPDKKRRVYAADEADAALHAPRRRPFHADRREPVLDFAARRVVRHAKDDYRPHPEQLLSPVSAFQSRVPVQNGGPPPASRPERAKRL